MKVKRTSKLCLVLSLGLLVFSAGNVMALTSTEICAAPGTTDTDKDGFSDQLECSGFPLNTTMSLNAGGTAMSIGGYSASGATDTMDPSVPDVFVMLVSAPVGSLIPASPLSELVKATSLGGLGVRAHEMATDNKTSSDASERQVSPVAVQKAVKVTENLINDTNTTLGISNYGTPMGPDGAQIYTQRIKNDLNAKYGALSQPATLLSDYIRHTIAHEIAHCLKLTTTSNTKSGIGYHYASGSKTVLDQFVSFSVKGSTVTNTLGNTFTTADQTGKTFNP